MREIFQTAAMLLFYITQKIYHNNICIFLKVYCYTLFQKPELGGAGIVRMSSIPASKLLLPIAGNYKV
jgi:hypothetical protein